jgi:catechol 2,3-dioxygenase-like lactoylglutathione lyase family enzyme
LKNKSFSLIAMEIRTANTILYCNNWLETVAFYREKLQLEVTVARDWFVEFELNEKSRLSIADASRATLDSCEGRGITLTMAVDDLEKTHAQLQATGLHPPPIRKHSWGAQVVYIHDPEGNRLEFWSS